MFDETKVLRVLMEGGGPYGDVFTEDKTYTHIQIESGRIEKLEKGEDKGVGIRLINPWKTFYASTNSFDEARLVDIARHLAKFSQESRGGETGAEGCIAADYPFTIDVNPDGVEIEKKLAMVRNLETTVKSMEPRIKQVRVIYRDTLQKVRICSNTAGAMEDNRTQVVLNIFLVGEENGEMQTSYEAVGGFYGFEFFTDQVVEELAAKTVKRLSGLLSAREAPMGTKTVVLASEAGRYHDS